MRPAGGRLSGARPPAAVPRRGGATAPGGGLGAACSASRAMHSPPSATSCTRSSRAPRSGSSSAGTSPTTTARPPRDRCSSTTSATCSTRRSCGIACTRAMGAVDGVQRRARRPRRAGGDRCATRELLGALRERVWSASSLERWIRCPMAWFVERMLRPRAIEPDPEPLARGGLAHAALRDTLEGLRRETGTARADPVEPRTCTRAAAPARSPRTSPSTPVGQRPSVAPPCAAACTPTSSATWSCAAEADSPLEPHGARARLRLRRRATSTASRATCPRSSSAAGSRLRGRIDRVDVGPGGEAVVYDYKGSSGAAPGGEVDRRRQPAGGAVHARGRAAPRPACRRRPLPAAHRRRPARRGACSTATAGSKLDCVETDVLDHAGVRELLDGALAAARRGRRAGGSRRARGAAADLRVPGRLHVSRRSAGASGEAGEATAGDAARHGARGRSRADRRGRPDARAAGGGGPPRRAAAAVGRRRERKDARCSSSASCGRSARTAIAPCEHPRDHLHRARRRRAARARALAAAGARRPRGRARHRGRVRGHLPRLLRAAAARAPARRAP